MIELRDSVQPPLSLRDFSGDGLAETNNINIERGSENV